MLEQLAPSVKLLHNCDKQDRLAGFASNAVAQGCVLRALDKTAGPRRFLDTSIAYMEHVPFEADPVFHRKLRKEQQALQPQPDPPWIRKGHDGIVYVFNVVTILLRKVGQP